MEPQRLLNAMVVRGAEKRSIPRAFNLQVSLIARRGFMNGFSFIQVLLSLVLLVSTAIPLLEYYWHIERMGQKQRMGFLAYLARVNAYEQ